MMTDEIKLLLLKEALEFINEQPNVVVDKIYYNIKRVLQGEKNSELFKKLENSEIWEFRTKFLGKAYRLFAFWDKERLIIATHGIIKKKQKTPHKEIAKAEKIREIYFRDKNY